MKMLSMKDIANLSGVSLKTVSRVLNNSDEVKESTRQKVMKIVEEYGYQKNIVAKSLKERKTNTIIVLIDRHKGDYWGIWHTIMLNKIMEKGKKRGYKVIISPSNAMNSFKEDTDGFPLLTSGLADGAVIFDNVRNDVRIDYLNKHSISYVVVGKNVDNNQSKWVDLDNKSAGYVGGKYLIERKYHSICFLLGREEYIVSQERAKGFEEAALEYNIKDVNTIFGISTMNKAYEIVNKHLKENKIYRAYYVSGDERALGVYRAILENGYKIPEDIAVLGIDNIPICDYLYPSLSSINQPVDEFCEYILNMLIKQINGEEILTSNEIVLPYEMVVREST